MDKDNEIIPSELSQEVVLNDDALDIIEKRAKLWEGVMRVALSATTAADWVDQNGKPYLQATGAEKVARRFGVRIENVEFDREDITDDTGRYYLYTVTGRAVLKDGESIETIGTCSSRDKFFGRKDGEYKKVEDVDIGNVKKKAYTNFLGNAITRLLGIRGLTWEHLGKYGITKAGKTSVPYAGKSAAPVSQPASKFSWPEGCGAWDWTNPASGDHYVYAKLGKHFQVDFLKNLGMRPDQKDEKRFWGKFSEGAANALIERFLEVEGA